MAQGIVTNRHVASGTEALQLATWNGTEFNASVQSISEMPGPDLSVLSGGWTTAPAILATCNVASGSQVWAAGYPEGDQLSLIPGIVLDYIDGTAYGLPGQIMALTNAVKPGNSGSPLLDGDGQVVGVVFAESTATGKGLAIPQCRSRYTTKEQPSQDATGCGFRRPFMDRCSSLGRVRAGRWVNTRTPSTTNTSYPASDRGSLVVA